MSIGREIAMARKRKGYTQETLSVGIPTSRESLAKYETESRVLPKDLHKHISEKMDDPQLFFHIWREAAGTVSIPLLNGEHVDHHPSSMMYMVQKETGEALEHLESICWFKPANAWSDREKDEMKQAMHEVLDATASMMNLVAILCDRYGFSMNDIFKYWQVSLKARKYTNS
ncbi:helix-turn-helix transcriptional regulator [Priestia taiwanensis]|uniref:Uncharacterized protein n=1 Tax=Priestia taiwanensis TaxID=1347902 RepID=A0A917AL86_9BACI|nr:helix-turn-helix transcriptional regulator [Priestia taiwanensis]MBM7361963.1 hypothetical protein [Priestia taiwanensis]GGE58385.1 hypothetical protein GCM10007140_05920 [Priestia taiwanensis]